MVLTTGGPKARLKVEEFRRISDVAAKRGCKALRVPETEEWPDGYFEESDGTKVPVEVVRAFQRLPDEDPRQGGPWMRARARAQQEAALATERTRIEHAFGAHYGEPFVVPLDGTHLIPMSTRPVRPDEWILAAVRQKVAKNYAEPSVLIVDLLSPFVPDVADWALGERAAEEAQGQFLEIWIATEYGDPPGRLI